MMNSAHTHTRRETDRLEEIEKLGPTKVLQLIHADLQSIKAVQIAQTETLRVQAEAIIKVKEIVEVWDNTKGFVNTIKFVAKIAMWVSLFLGGVAAVVALW